MKYCSKKITLFTIGKTADSAGVQRTEKPNAGRYQLSAKAAFSLVEVVVALVILAFISSSVLVVINRYMAAAADSVLRMQAFEVARTNMEKLLTADSATDSVEFGTSEMYPDIEWETVVETFYEPLTSRMWVQAVCSAEYTDSEGEVQEIELTHWYPFHHGVLPRLPLRIACSEELKLLLYLAQLLSGDFDHFARTVGNRLSGSDPRRGE